MSARHEAVQGDIGDTLVVELEGVADFTGASAIATVWRADAAAVVLTAAVVNGTSPTGSPCGVCTVQLGTWLATALGRYSIEYTVTFTNGNVLTWPASTPDTLVVRADG